MNANKTNVMVTSRIDNLKVTGRKLEQVVNYNSAEVKVKKQIQNFAKHFTRQGRRKGGTRP